MKLTNQLIGLLTRSTLVAAIAGATLLPNPLAAQEKGAELLMKLNRLNTTAEVQKVAGGDTVVMSCPKCKDSWVKVVQPMGKPGRQETATVQRHACPGCEKKFVTEGVGKQAKDVVKHICKQCGSADAFCCVVKKGSDATAGMVGSQGHQH